MPESKFLQKLVKVYEEVDHVDKRGTNSKQGYKFVRSADVLHAIRGAFLKFGLYAETQFELLSTYDIPTNSGGNMHTATVKATINIYDSENSLSMITVSGLGDGADSGDKGIYKAQTGAVKNALRNAFLVPDEEDPEADERVDEATEPAPRTQSVQSSQVKNKPGRPKKVETPAGPGPEKAVVPSLPQAPVSGEPVPLKAELAYAGSLPTETEKKKFLKQAGDLVEKLQEAGLGEKDGLSAGKRVGRLIKKRAKKDSTENLTKEDWVSFFEKVNEKVAEGGYTRMVQIIEESEKL